MLDFTWLFVALTAFRTDHPKILDGDVPVLVFVLTMFFCPQICVATEYAYIEQGRHEEGWLVCDNGVGDPKRLTCDVDIPCPPDLPTREQESEDANDTHYP